jgi:membrane associated rhomboid family serine protease
MRPPDSWQSARITLLIAAITAAAWLLAFATGRGDLAATLGGFVPARLSGPAEDAILAAIVTPLTATLVHGGLIHLGFNLLAFLFCGRAVETILGGRGIVILYLVGAYAAAAAQFVATPHGTLPMVGASGAISAVIGAYAMMFGRNRVNVANPALARWLHALWLAAAWIVLQLLIGFTFRVPIGSGSQGINIAFAAHIGGFLAGLALAKPLLLLKWRGA